MFTCAVALLLRWDQLQQYSIGECDEGRVCVQGDLTARAGLHQQPTIFHIKHFSSSDSVTVQTSEVLKRMLSLSLLTLSGRINKPNFLLKSQPPPLCDDWQTAPPTHAHRVETARHSFNCHEATRWRGVRVTYDWHCSRGLVRVTAEERRVGGWHRGKQTAVQCSWAARADGAELSVGGMCQFHNNQTQERAHRVSLKESKSNF